MKFCPKCDGMLTIRKGIAVCKNCGFKTKSNEKIVLKQSYDHSHDKIIVADGRKIQGRLYSVLCPKCGSSLSILINQRKKLYKCSLCGNMFNYI
ncbi:transcription factor S4 [Sulfuracidifex metallicus]|uniref:transcription factor S4 n=1 Tax=Sulfuracidifex metallicus TaxID=47303 RepID=UPI003C701604